MRHPSLIPLSQDHHHGLALALRCRKQALGQIRPMGVEGLRERAGEVKDFFTRNLERHFQAEEEILFPLLRASVPDSVALIEGLLGEHRQIRKSVRGLGQEKYLAKLLFDIGDLLERHIRREERELFPLFENRIPPVQAEGVKARIARILSAEGP